MKGFVHVYTGDGKGKTTAALGLALRAAGAGRHVFIAQFLKHRPSSELEALKQLSNNITVRQYGDGDFVQGEPTEGDTLAARKGFQEIREAIMSGAHDVVILDEANLATFFNLFSVNDLLDLINTRPEHVELVITGRKADPAIIERADLVTDMRMVKHYYEQGITARKGIEE